MTEKIKVAIVDDHPLFRDGVATRLSREQDVEIAGQGMTAEDAVRLATSAPDVMLLDITMPGGGLQAARAIATTHPSIKIVMLTASEEEEDVLAALKSGAKGYVLKGVSARELVNIIHAVYAGEAYVNPTLAATLLSEISATEPSARKANPLDDLTERERQILELVADGHSNREVAQQLFLSEKTIKDYMTSILQKLHVRNRVEAALLLHRNEGSELKS